MTRLILRHQAYARFKERLFAQDLSPGQFVTQRELSVMMDVPVGPLREALKRLEAENLVRLIPQRGIQIAELNVTVLNDAYGLRRIIESAATRHFALEAPMPLIRKMEAELKQALRNARANPDREALDAALRLDWALHDVVIDEMGNQALSEVHRLNFDKLRLVRRNRRFTPERVAPALEELLAIVAAFRARDPEAAVVALDRHLTVAHHRALGLAP
jgi:DNA-binding GntR family transcriptional regulator